jgi:2-polyprenyl-6-methoxyphenol hydroxylase-like FAD-dependent oxidoreductase
MAGMLAARALADHLPVTIVERDALATGPEARRGLPQAVHLHAILSRGMNLLERNFAGLRDELVAHGAVPVDSGTEVGWLGPFGWSAPFERGAIETVWATRVRERLRRDVRIGWLQNTRVESLVVDSSSRAVRGVRGTDGHVIDASLVVDATGRGSKLPDWLRAVGFVAPPETEVDAHTTYTSALARLSRPLPKKWKVLFVLGLAPSILRGGVIGAVEGGRVLVSLVTVGGQSAPGATSEFAAFGRSLRAPFLGDLLDGADWLSPARTTRSTANRWRHYDRVPLPTGLIVVGDALCAFNPVFGQGISVAAMQAETLEHLLRTHGATGPKLAQVSARRFVSLVNFPWAMATGQDRQVIGGGDRAGLPQRLMKAYLDRLFSLATRDGGINMHASHVFNLTASPLTLYTPRVALRVVRQPLPVRVVGPVPPPEPLAPPSAGPPPA